MSPSSARTLIDEISRRPVAEPTHHPGLAQIARELILGEATIKTHVSRIPAKLGASDCVQAVVTVYESGKVMPGE